jgi:hypothetical protein
MTLAAVAGTTFFAGNIFPVPLTDFITELINLGDQLLIVPERLQMQIPLITDFDKMPPVHYT